MYEKKLDEAIDRTVRDMTYVAADDDAVARVMARLREVDAPAATGGRWMFAPRVAWAGAAALLLIAIVTGYSLSLRSTHRGTSVPRVAENTPAAQPAPSVPPAPSAPLVATNKIPPTQGVPAPSTMQATTARETRGHVVTPSSIVSDPADASEGRGQLEMPPLESDMVIASITPAPLADAPAIQVEPLSTSSLQVDEISVPSIDMPPVSPERRE